MEQSAATPAFSTTDPVPLADVIPFPGVPVEPPQVVGFQPPDEPDDVHGHTIECSPLWATHGNRPGWHGEIVTDPAEIAAIRRRVQAGADSRGAWRRTLRRIRRGR